MALGREEFSRQLRELGYEVTETGTRVEFDYEVPVGKLIGTRIRLGFDIPPDFPVSPPTGPHVKPRIHQNAGGGTHPTGGIHDSAAFGQEWHYWSRPCSHWQTTGRSVKEYMAHIRHLMETQ